MKLYEKDIETGLEDIFRPTKALKELLSYPKTVKYYTKGHSLDKIAHIVYGDSSLWRLIAEYNGIVNPYLIPSEIYVIPKDKILEVENESV